MAGESGAPESGACGKRDFYEVALVVAYGVAGLYERFAFLAKENAIAGFLDVGEKDGLLVVASDVEGESAGLIGVTGAEAECGERR